MQSPAGVMLRALVMLGCVVAIPLAAMFGSSLPKLVSAVLEGHWPPSAAASDRPATTPPPPARIPPAGPAEPSTPGRQPEPLRSHSAGPAAWPDRPAIRPAAYEVEVGPAGPLAGPARLSGPTPPAVPPGLGGRTPGPSWGREDPGWQVDPATGSGRDWPARSSPPRILPAPEVESALAASPQGAEQFRYVQERLRQLGRTYFLLETWGTQQELYRAYCKVAVGGNANYTRHFEATHSDPLQAMLQVLQQVEAWRAARQ